MLTEEPVLPVYFRIGQGEESQIGTITLTPADHTPSLVLAQFLFAAALAADNTTRQRIADALRSLAPGQPVLRVWGRTESATPEQAQEGNAWAADVDDLAGIVLDTLTGEGR